MSGYVKLHRKVLESMVWQDPNPLTAKVFMHCLLRANFKETVIYRGGEEIKLVPGQFIYSRNKWAKDLGVSPSTLRNTMEKLQKWDTIQDSFRDNGIATIFQITNWEKYQCEDSFEDSFEDKVRTKLGQSKDTQKNVKNVKNEKKTTITPLPPRGKEEKLFSLNPVTLDGKPLAMSTEVRELWDYWAENLAPITTNHGFHRNALSEMLNQFGSDGVKKMIRVAGTAHTDQFAGKNLKISTPREMADRWPALLLYAKSKIVKEVTREKGFLDD